jgi:biopolymer transport protein ExbD
MKHTRAAAELPTSSMADIAFLLLTFFLVTTVIDNDKGLTIQLPQWQYEPPTIEIPARNLFTVQINSAGQFLVEGERVPDLSRLREEVRNFVMNNGRFSTLSDSPEAAVVSLQTDRNTSHRDFIAALDEIQGAYYEIYARRAGISTDVFRALDQRNAEHKAIYEKARKGIPMNISIAEPTRTR